MMSVMRKLYNTGKREAISDVVCWDSFWLIDDSDIAGRDGEALSYNDNENEPDHISVFDETCY